MARVAGIDLPKNKRIDVALEYIYGIGKKNGRPFCFVQSVSVCTDFKNK